MSRRPGIARDFYEKYPGDIFPSNTVTFKGQEMAAPKFYRNILKDEQPHEYEKLKRRLKIIAKKHLKDATPKRLHVREKCKSLQLNQQKGSLK